MSRCLVLNCPHKSALGAKAVNDFTARRVVSPHLHPHVRRARVGNRSSHNTKQNAGTDRRHAPKVLPAKGQGPKADPSQGQIEIATVDYVALHVRESVLLSHSRWLTWLASPSLAWRVPREGVAKRPYSVSRAMAKPKTQWPKSSAAMPFVAPAESRWYRSWIS